MQTLFYLLGTLSLICTILTIFQKNPIYAIFYLLLSFICISFILFLLGALFSAAIEIIIYAGAVMILFIFVIMMLNINYIEDLKFNTIQEKFLIIAPIIICILLFLIILHFIQILEYNNIHATVINTQLIGKTLFTDYVTIVELISMLLLSSLIVCIHIGQSHE